MKKNVRTIALVCLAIAFTACLLLSCPLEMQSGNQTGLDKTPDNLLFLSSSDDYSSTKNDVFINFNAPEELGATSYTLQYSTDNVTWQNFQYYASDLVTTQLDQDNFSIDINYNCYLRLLIAGGPYDGRTSNETYCTRCTTGGFFRSNSLDESLWHTGIMSPNVGYGLVAEFLVEATPPPADTEIENCLTYQWYRLDPENYENMILIPGATSLSYTTTEADKGYFMVIKATGNGIDFDGFKQLKSVDIVR